MVLLTPRAFEWRDLRVPGQRPKSYSGGVYVPRLVSLVSAQDFMVARNPITACVAAAVVFVSVLTCEKIEFTYSKAADAERRTTGRTDSAAAHYPVAVETGVASWYGRDHKGRRTASGEPFIPSGFTCASWHYPFQTLLRVSSSNGKSVIVRVNDRGPARRLHRIIDLSEASFAALADTKLGLIPVTIERIK